MNMAIDSLKNMLAYREADINRSKSEVDRLLEQVTNLLSIRSRQLKEIEDLKNAINTLEKNNG